MQDRLSPTEQRRLQRLEEALWRAETRFDRAFMAGVLADDFLEIGRSGRVYGKDDILAVASQPLEAVIPLPDFTVRLLAPGLAQVTYNSHVTDQGRVQKARRSSLWSRTPAGWVLRFHQGTPHDDDGEPGSLPRQQSGSPP